MKIKVKLDDGAILPSRAHAADAGYDLYTREFLLIKPGSSKTVDTTERGDGGFGSTGR